LLHLHSITIFILLHIEYENQLPTYLDSDNSLAYDYKEDDDSSSIPYGTRKPGNYGSSGWIPITPAYKKHSHPVSHAPSHYPHIAPQQSTKPYYLSSTPKPYSAHQTYVSQHPELDVIPSVSYDFSYKMPQPYHQQATQINRYAPNALPYSFRPNGVLQKYPYVPYQSGSHPVNKFPVYNNNVHSLKSVLGSRQIDYESSATKSSNERLNYNDEYVVRKPNKYYTPKLDLSFKSKSGSQISSQENVLSLPQPSFQDVIEQKLASIALQVPYSNNVNHQTVTYTREYILPSIDYEIPEETRIVPRLQGYYRNATRPIVFPKHSVDKSATVGSSLNPIRISAKNVQPSVSHYHGSKQ